jgi:hypothetical protein
MSTPEQVPATPSFERIRRLAKKLTRQNSCGRCHSTEPRPSPAAKLMSLDAADRGESCASR